MALRLGDSSSGPVEILSSVRWATRKIRGSSGTRRILELSYSADDWFADFDARPWLADVMDAVLAHHRDAIKRGEKPVGGQQKPLGSWIYTDAAQTNLRRDVRRRVSMFRGYATGHFADDLTRTEIKGGAGRARCEIRAPDDRRYFLAQEARRGVEYLGVGGRMVRLIDEASKRYVEIAADIEGTWDTQDLRARRTAAEISRILANRRRRQMKLKRRANRRPT